MPPSVVLVHQIYTDNLVEYWNMPFVCYWHMIMFDSTLTLGPLCPFESKCLTNIRKSWISRESFVGSTSVPASYLLSQSWSWKLALEDFVLQHCSSLWTYNSHSCYEPQPSMWCITGCGSTRCHHCTHGGWRHQDKWDLHRVEDVIQVADWSLRGIQVHSSISCRFDINIHPLCQRDSYFIIIGFIGVNI